MLERLVSLVTRGALPCVLVAKVDGVLECAVFCSDRLSAKCLIDRRVASAAFVSDDLPVGAEVLAVMAAKTALRVIVADVISRRLPICLHLGKEIGLIEPLYLGNR